jgi:hypothetical protein
MRTRQAAGLPDTRKIQQLLDTLVMSAVEDVANSYEVTQVDDFDEVGRRHFSSGSPDLVSGAEFSTYLGYMSSTGQYPANTELRAVLDASVNRTYAFAQREWSEQNKSFIEENGLTPEQINYKDLQELGHYAESEEIAEFEDDPLYDENVVFYLAAFYFDAESHRSRTPMLEVVALVSFDGMFLPNQSMTLYKKQVEVKNLADLKKKATVFLAAAASEME